MEATSFQYWRSIWRPFDENFVRVGYRYEAELAYRWRQWVEY